VLLVPTTLRRSPIHGLGVFLAEPVAAGTETWRFVPGFDVEFEPAEIERFPPHVRRWLDHFAYLDFHLDRWILAVDDARFMNHSDMPSTRSDYERDPYGVDVAARDLAVGEELTCDYRSFERSPDRDLE